MQTLLPGLHWTQPSVSLHATAHSSWVSQVPLEHPSYVEELQRCVPRLHSGSIASTVVSSPPPLREDGPLASGINVFDDHPTPLPPDTNVPPATDNGTHSGINRKPAALRFAQAFLVQDTLVQQCMVNGQPAPCDCATGACN